jgi:hypothetical protein
MDQLQFSRHRRAVGSRRDAEESRRILAALHKNQRPESTLEILVEDFTHVTDETNFLLALWECPPEFRTFIDALIGLAGYRAKRNEWFSASDKEIARRANRRSTKWVQIQRKEFLKWQNRNNVAMMDVEDNSYNDGHPIPHRYRVHLASIAAESTLNARQSRTWGVNPGIALEEAARTMRDALPEAPPVHRSYQRSRRPDAEQQIERQLGLASTMVKKTIETNRATGYNVELNPVMLERIEEIKNGLAVLVENARIAVDSPDL